MADSSSLVLRLQAGDQTAVNDLYSEFGRSVWAVAHRVLGRRDLADDATQQTFLQVWKHAATLDSDRPLGPWLHTVARRFAIGLLRKEHPEREVALDAPVARAAAAPNTEFDTRTWETWQVRTAIEALPPDERQTLRLTHYEGYSHSEAADRLGVPIGTIKSRMGRAYKRLASGLGHLRDESELT